MLRLIILVAAIGAAWAPPSALAETHALVIGSNYDQSAEPHLKLANPIADARMVSAALLGAQVDKVTLLEEPDALGWDEGFNLFASSLQDDDVALVYFAGHGFQIDGENYLLASDGTSLIALSPILDMLTDRAKGVIVVIDACRDNPLTNAGIVFAPLVVEVTDLSRSLEFVTLEQLAAARSGLSQLSNLRGQSALVFFSTEPGNVAEDGDPPGSGSLFARIFSREIRERKSLDKVFRSISLQVFRETDGRQAPWRQGDLHFGVFIAGMRSLPIP